MTFRLTRRAATDVVDIYVRGVVEFGARQAEAYHGELEVLFEFLAANPLAARERAEFRPPVRIHPFGAHVVVYVIESDDILIVRVLHGRSDWERHL